MSDPQDVRIPLPHEHSGRRRINAVVLATLGAAMIALGAVYLLRPKAARESPSAVKVTVLEESTGRAQQISFRAEDSPQRLAERYRKAKGRSATFNDVAHPMHPSAWLEKTVCIDQAPVLTALGERIFAIGPTEVDSILVRLEGPKVKVSPGEAVFVVGRLLPTPSENTRRKWGLTPDEERLIGNRTVYLRAAVVVEAK